MRRKSLLLPLLVSLLVTGCGIINNKGNKEGTEFLLANRTDSLIYAAGRANSANGMMTFINVFIRPDSAYMSEFVSGFKEGIKKHLDTAYQAKLAGHDAAALLFNEVIPNTKKSLEIDNFNEAIFIKGVIDLISEDEYIFNEHQAAQLVKQYIDSLAESKDKANREVMSKFIESMENNPNVQKTSDGLLYTIIESGNGPTPKYNDLVTFKYTVSNIDGSYIDNSVDMSNDGVSLRLDTAVKGLRDAISLMNVGSKYEFYIPAEQLYAEGSIPVGITPTSMLILAVELISIN